jgi:hypothetical protein
MHLYDTITGTNAIDFCKQQLKMDSNQYDLNNINRIEVFGTNFTDEGEDYCEYRVYDNEGKVIAVKRESGY